MTNTKGIAVAMVALSMAACTDEGATFHTLESAGYSRVQVTGYEPFACGRDDTFATGFMAQNPAGKTVTGTVCCGMILKGCTIRF